MGRRDIRADGSERDKIGGKTGERREREKGGERKGGRKSEGGNQETEGDMGKTREIGKEGEQWENKKNKQRKELREIEGKRPVRIEQAWERLKTEGEGEERTEEHR